MTDGNDAPNVKIIPPLVYLAGIVIGFLATIWMPTKVVPNSVAWTVGGILICCGAVLTGSALLKFKDVGTTVRPDRAASTLVIGGPYKITRNPMYLGMAVFYFGIAVLDQWIWALILLPVVLGAALNVAAGRVPSVCSRVLENGTNCGGRTKPSYLPANGASVVCPRRERRGTLQPQ
jgi:protein-S-isoprenylcysteine O-methyltransferase Ste14